MIKEVKLGEPERPAESRPESVTLDLIWIIPAYEQRIPAGCADYIFSVSCNGGIAVETRKLTFTALFMAVGVLSAHLIYIPVGVSKCFPVQHSINVLLAVLIGTRYSVGAAFGVSVLRNILGTGSLLAFPGSMIGAALSGILYTWTNSIWGAVIGEIVGTGI